MNKANFYCRKLLSIINIYWKSSSHFYFKPLKLHYMLQLAPCLKNTSHQTETLCCKFRGQNTFPVITESHQGVLCNKGLITPKYKETPTCWNHRQTSQHSFHANANITLLLLTSYENCTVLHQSKLFLSL